MPCRDFEPVTTLLLAWDEIPRHRARSHSFDGEERHWNASSVEKYIAGAPAGKEVLTRRDRFNEYVMTALRTVEGIEAELAAIEKQIAAYDAKFAAATAYDEADYKPTTT